MEEGELEVVGEKVDSGVEQSDSCSVGSSGEGVGGMFKVCSEFVGGRVEQCELFDSLSLTMLSA